MVKLNASGASLEHATFLGGSGDDYGFGIAVDGSGKAYITGRTSSSHFPAASGPGYDTSHNGGFDAFVVKLAMGGSGDTSYIYLPIIHKAPPTYLYVQNKTTGPVTYTVYNTPQGDITCSNIPAGTTQFCGSFSPGTYQARADTTQCGSYLGEVNFPSGPVTRIVECRKD